MIRTALVLDGLIPIPVEDFEEYLKSCPDYVRHAWADGASYRFRHSNKPFAEVRTEESEHVYVTRDVLE